MSTECSITQQRLLRHCVQCCAALATISVATGEIRADQPRARALFTAATAHFRAGAFRRALGLYQRAYAHAALPGFHFNIGQCHARLGQHRAAVARFRAYLEESQRPKHRAEALALISLSERELRGSRAGAVADDPAERVPVDDDATRTAPRGPAVAVADAERPPRIPQALAETAEPDRADMRSSFPVTVFWTGVGLSAALLVTGAVSGVLALKTSETFKDPQTRQEDLRPLRDKGQALNAVSALGLGLGAAATAATAVLYFYTDFGEEGSTGVRAALGPSPTGASIGVSATF